MACAWLGAALGTESPPIPDYLREAVSPAQWRAVCGLAVTGVGSPLTTSAGRLFDAAAAICGLRARAAHEGQAAMELEGVCDAAETGAFEMPLIAEPSGPSIIDPRDAVATMTADLGRGAAVGNVAMRFHNGLADATAAAVVREARRRGLETAVLSGGVFQNRLLIGRTAARLRAAGLRVLIPELLPPNDGQISYGQVAVTVAREGGGR
jgi:hydrogenase maturation protein HypF